jgi:trigger factor
MKYTLTDKSKLEKTLTVPLSREALNTSIDSHLKKIGKNIKMPGFRPGKVPFKLIKEKYYTSGLRDATDELAQKSFNDFLKESKVSLASYPKIDFKNLDNEQSDLEIIYDFEILPEVPELNYENIKIEKKVPKIVDADVDEAIKRIRKDRSDFVETDKKIEKDFKVFLDFTGKVDGKEFEGGNGKNVELVVGSGTFLADFENGIIGMVKDEEKTIEVNFPENYGQKSLAGKKAEFLIKINKIFSSIIPELDKNFLEKLGITDGNMDTFKKQIKDSLHDQAESISSSKLKEELVSEFTNSNPIDLPKSMVHEEIHRIMESTKKDLINRGIPEDKINIPHDSLEGDAKKRVHTSLLFKKIIETEPSVKASKKQIDDTIENFAKTYKDSDKVKDWYYQDANRLRSVESIVTEGNIVDWLTKKIVPKEVEVPFMDLIGESK